jgi:glycosyltransferase involved in cell wall biosynthesis
LLRAWPEIRSLVPSAQLVFVGSGPDEGLLRAVGAPNVLFAGARDDVDTWLEASSVVVVPSRWEALSLGLLEAMAAGRTVVATDVDGVREALGDELGAVVPPEDPGALVHPVVERLLDRELAALEGKRSAERAKERFDAERTHDEIAELYVRHLDRIRYRGDDGVIHQTA